jgi:predicted enzyme related to lactoylglutathione lyase
MTLRVGDVVVDCADPEILVAFWQAAMGDYVRHDLNEQYVAIAPIEPAPGRLAILFQKVPEPKVGKNRLHLDLRGESMTAAVERLRALGASVIAERSLGDAVRWTVMADPEGNEFCVVEG